MKKVFLVKVIESERGWGKKIDDYMVCQNEDDAKIFIYEFNLENNKDVVPDWYMMAESKLIEKEISDTKYEKLKSKNMMWLSELNKTE